MTRHNTYRGFAMVTTSAWLFLFFYAWRRPDNWTAHHFAALSLLCASTALFRWLAYRRASVGYSGL